jgi:Cellulase (glycosyl hydrolase family 5)
MSFKLALGAASVRRRLFGGAGSLTALAAVSFSLGCGSPADAEPVPNYQAPPPGSEAGTPSGVASDPSAAPASDGSGASPAATSTQTPTPTPEGEAQPSDLGLDPATPEGEAPAAGEAPAGGEVAPALAAVPGVVVVDASGPVCAPLCPALSGAVSPDGGDWAVLDGVSCVLQASLTAISNQACTTGSPLPSPEPLPGVLVGDGLGSACRPLCVALTTPSSPDAPDWAFERNASCVLPGSATANAAARRCTFGGPDVEVELVPPPLTGTKVAPGFFVQNGRLLDAYGEDFVIRGVNNPHIWFDVSARYAAYLALDTIAGFGTNTIRVVWDTTGSAALLREVLFRVVELGMVPMVELHDVTSSTSRAALVNTAAYYAKADVRDVLNDFREYALINIANEWSGNDFFGAYQEALTYLRNNGIDHTLVIDANGFGQNGQAILDNAAALTAADPERNLLFSVHMYESFGTANAVDNLLNAAQAGRVPLIVGEFGPVHGGRTVAWERILTRTNELGIGYLPWSWFGNDATTANLDMTRGPGGPLTAWGQDVMMRTPGNIQSTSVRASIFE